MRGNRAWRLHLLRIGRLRDSPSRAMRRNRTPSLHLPWQFQHWREPQSRHTERKQPDHIFWRKAGYRETSGDTDPQIRVQNSKRAGLRLPANTLNHGIFPIRPYDSLSNAIAEQRQRRDVHPSDHGNRRVFRRSNDKRDFGGQHIAPVPADAAGGSRRPARKSGVNCSPGTGSGVPEASRLR